MIETFAFYIYMFAAVGFIFEFQLRSTWLNAPVSDITKSVKDFITYASINLTWYSFNFVLIIVPGLLIFMMDTEHDGIRMHHRKGSYHNLMLWLWGTHIVQFIINRKIYVLQERTEDDDGFQNPGASSDGPSLLSKVEEEQKTNAEQE